MNIEHYWKTAQQWHLQRNGSFLLNIILSLSLLVMTMGVVTSKERVILTPMWGGESMWLEVGEASPEYLQKMAVFFVGCVLNNNPTHMAWNREMALKSVSSDFYGEFRKKLMEEESTMKQNGISTLFDTQKVESLDSTTVRLEGTLISYVRGKEVSREKETYVLTFRSQGHTFLINSFQKEVKPDA